MALGIIFTLNLISGDYLRTSSWCFNPIPIPMLGTTVTPCLSCSGPSRVLPHMHTPSRCLTRTPLQLSPSLSLSHRLPYGRQSDCWLVLPGDLRPASMPPEYNWMAEVKEPSMGKRGSRGTHTSNTHTNTNRGKYTLELLPCFTPYPAQHISAHPLVVHGGVSV